MGYNKFRKQLGINPSTHIMTIPNFSSGAPGGKSNYVPYRTVSNIKKLQN